jgi:16S rRNA G966 N2-methylase RsmD
MNATNVAEAARLRDVMLLFLGPWCFFRASLHQKGGNFFKVHRVICGSALEIDAYAQLMDGKSASMVFTDPPYNVPIAGHVSGLGATQHREFAMGVGEMSVTQFTAFLGQALRAAAKHSTGGESIQSRGG